MSIIEVMNRDSAYRYLRTQDDVNAGTTWCFMHARRAAQDLAYRPCFSAVLLKEIREFQIRSTESLRRRAPLSGNSALHHVILASDADVFNLGGDLDLFCRLIRNHDRQTLLAYARQCVDVAYAFHSHLNESVHTVALVQGDALGGGFEAALCCQTIIAESGVGMGLPEVLFDLFPGMGAYAFLCKRVSPRMAEQMMLDGQIYSSDELHRMGVVDILVPRGEGVSAAQDFVRKNQRIPHARNAMNRVRAACHPVSFEELMTVTEIWVDTALQLGDKSLRTMERLVRAQLRREPAPAPVATTPWVQQVG